MRAAFYDKTTGAILGTATGPDTAISADPRPSVEVPDALPFDNLPQAYWIQAGVLTACAAITPAWDTATQTLSGLPPTCTVRLEGSAYDITDGIAEFGSLVAGDYDLAIRAVGFLPVDMTVTV